MIAHIIEYFEQLDPSMMIGYFILLLSLFQVVWFKFAYRKEIFPDLRGADGWQFLEISGVIWLILFPAAILATFFGLHLSKEGWYALEIIYLINIMGKNANKLIEWKFKGLTTEEKKIEIKQTTTQQKPPDDTSEAP